jgi:hypothetical protein
LRHTVVLFKVSLPSINIPIYKAPQSLSNFIVISSLNRLTNLFHTPHFLLTYSQQVRFFYFNKLIHPDSCLHVHCYKSLPKMSFFI